MHSCVDDSFSQCSAKSLTGAATKYRADDETSTALGMDYGFRPVISSRYCDHASFLFGWSTASFVYTLVWFLEKFKFDFHEICHLPHRDVLW